MNFYNIQKITVMDIQVFLKCAELENFSQAAAEMQISVASVSKIIAALEYGMELILFVRNKNKVRLTPAGKILYGSWKSFEDSFLIAFEQAHKVQAAKNDPVVFGIESGVDPARFFSPFLYSWKATFPEHPSKVETANASALIKHLLADDFDVAFLPEHMHAEIAKYPELEYIPVLSSTLYACVSAENPLAHESRLSWSNLKTYGFIIPSPLDSPYYYRWVSGLCEENGFTPRIDRYIAHVSSACFNLTGQNVFVLDSFSKGYCSMYGEFRELSNTRSHIYLVWKKKNESAAPTIQFATEFFSMHDGAFR